MSPLHATGISFPNFNMFDNREYVDLQKQLQIDKIELVNKEYEMYKNWTENLASFINDAESKYLLINDCTVIKVEDTCSGVIKQGDKSVIHWFRLFGLVIYDDDLNLIYDSFSGIYKLNLTDKIQLITKEEFDVKFKEKCDIVFADTETNFNIQLHHYISRFDECVLEKYPEMFPQSVHDFVERLNEKLDNEDFF